MSEQPTSGEEEAAEPARLGGDYQRLLVASGLSNLGDGVRLAALPLLAVVLTDDPLLIAGVNAVTFLPAVVFGPVGGAVIDRHDRRFLLTAGQFGRGVAVLVFVALLLTDRAGIAALYVLAIVLGVGEVVVDGASQAAVPGLVPSSLLERANARMISAQLVFDQLIGSAVGGLLFVVSVVAPFVLDAATFLLGGATVRAIGRPLPPRDDEADEPGDSGLWSDVRDGFGYLWRHPLLRGMAAAVGIVNLAVASGASVLVLLVVEDLGAPEAAFGVVLAVGAGGGVLGSLVAERIVRALGRARTLVGATALVGIALALVVVVPNVLVLGAFLALQIFGVIVFNVPGQSVRQEVTPPHLLGRVVTSYRMLGYLGVPLGALLGGAVTAVVGVRAAYGVGALVMVGATLAMATAVRHLPPSDAPSTDAYDDGRG